MPPHRTGLRGERVRAAVAGAVLLVVAWQALVSARSVEKELLGFSPERHLRVFEASPEELIRRKLGSDYETLEALRAHVPRDGRVIVSFSGNRGEYGELKHRITWLGTLIYPVIVQGWYFEPGGGSRAPGNRAEREYVLDLDSGRDYSRWHCEELARGEHFRLLLVGSAPR